MNVTPILKKGKKENLGNYRSYVSLASISGRMMEKIMLETITKYTDRKVVRSGQC